MYNYTALNVSFTFFILSNILFNQNMIKISNIYVRITVSLLQLIYISWGMENSQH